jgi:hypothetical protein
MNIHWDTYPPFSFEDLNGKTAEFDLEDPTKWSGGIGIIRARKNPQGLIAVELEVVDHPHEKRRTQHRSFPTQAVRFRIERHPNQDVAAFRLSSYILPPAIQGSHQPPQ